MATAVSTTWRGTSTASRDPPVDPTTSAQLRTAARRSLDPGAVTVRCRQVAEPSRQPMHRCQHLRRLQPTRYRCNRIWILVPAHCANGGAIFLMANATTSQVQPEGCNEARIRGSPNALRPEPRL